MQKMVKTKKRDYKYHSEAQKQQMCDDFVHGYTTEDGFWKQPTVKEISDKFNISYNTVYKLAQRDEWQEKAKDYASKYYNQIAKVKRQELSKHGVEIDTKIIDITKNILNQVMKGLEQKGKEISGWKLDNFASASRKAQKMAKLALGEPTENMKVETVDATQSETFKEALETLKEIESEQFGRGTNASDSTSRLN